MTWSAAAPGDLPRGGDLRDPAGRCVRRSRPGAADADADAARAGRSAPPSRCTTATSSSACCCSTACTWPTRLAYVLKLFGFLIVAVVLLYSRAYLERPRHPARRVLRAGADRAARHLRADLGQQPADGVPRASSCWRCRCTPWWRSIATPGSRAEAAMKYFVLGAIASGALLYGMSMIYGLTGTLDLGTTRGAAARGRPTSGVAARARLHRGRRWPSSSAPCRSTCGCRTSTRVRPPASRCSSARRRRSPTSRWRCGCWRRAWPGPRPQWSQMLTVLAVLTLVVGNVVAIVQTNLKRMLAYSTIANVGFIVLGFVAGTPDGYAAAHVLHAGLRAGRARLLRRDPAGQPRGLRGRPAR